MKNKVLTQKETRKRAAQGLMEISAELLGITDKRTMEILRASFEQEKMHSNLLRAAIFHTLGRQIKSTIRRTPRLTERELETALARIRTFAPEMASVLRKELKEMERRLPRRGGPGRTAILNAEEKLEAVELVASTMKLGAVKNWPGIFDSVADTFRARQKKVSARTIKRIWESRKTLYLG